MTLQGVGYCCRWKQLQANHQPSTSVGQGVFSAFAKHTTVDNTDISGSSLQSTKVMEPYFLPGAGVERKCSVVCRVPVK